MRSFLTPFLTLIFTFFVIAIPTHAAPITVYIASLDQNYEVSTFDASYLQQPALIESQVWWGDEALAHEFAAAVGDHFGFPNPGDSSWGPLFGHTYVAGTPVTAGSVEVKAWWSVTNDVSGGSAWENLGWTWAQASPVPIPAAAWLFGSAILGLGALKRKRS